MGCKIAPASYYEHRSRTPSTREMRDEELKPKITAAHAANYGVFGARKVWLTLNRERAAGEAPIARCTVERLMAQLGLAGAVRGKVKRTTISDPTRTEAARPGEPQLPAARTGPALGCRLHLRLHLVGLVLHRVRHRRLRPPHPGLVGRDHDDQPARRRCRRAGGVDPAPRRQRPDRARGAPRSRGSVPVGRPTPSTSTPPGSSPRPGPSARRTTTPSLSR